MARTTHPWRQNGANPEPSTVVRQCPKPRQRVSTRSLKASAKRERLGSTRAEARTDGLILSLSCRGVSFDNQVLWLGPSQQHAQPHARETITPKDYNWRTWGRQLIPETVIKSYRWRHDDTSRPVQGMCLCLDSKPNRPYKYQVMQP